MNFNSIKSVILTCLLVRIRWMTGIAKAAVLPDPVRARTKTSFPSNSRGIALSWIRVGLSQPSFARAYKLKDN